MALITLFTNNAAASGRNFTASGFAGEAGAFVAIQSLTSLGDEIPGDGKIERTARNDAAKIARTVGYSPSGADRAATSYWDQLIQYNDNAQPERIRRDQITGQLKVDNSFLAPSGTVTAFTRYEGLTDDGSSINALFQVENGEWAANVFRPGEGAGFHTSLTAGNDTVIGSAGSDRIEAGSGVNRILGKEGADTFFISTGKKSKTSSKKKDSLGLLIGSRANPTGKSKNLYTYDKSVDIIEDYEAGIDQIALQGNPRGYSYETIQGSSWIFTGKNQNNLVAIVVDVAGLSAGDVIGW